VKNRKKEERKKERKKEDEEESVVKYKSVDILCRAATAA